MTKNKTSWNDKSVIDFLSQVENQTRREDSFKMLELIKATTGFEPKMYGSTIIGFGNYHYTYPSGREGDAPVAGFSPRKDCLALYVEAEFDNKEELLTRLGKHKTAKVCIYLKKLTDLNVLVLEEIIKKSVRRTAERYPVQSPQLH